MSHEKIQRIPKKDWLRLGREVVRCLLEYEVATGEIAPTEKDMKSCLRRLMKDVAAGRAKYEWAMDFTPRLLRLARSAKSAGDAELSCVYYATWTEHKLNRFIRDFLIKHRGDQHHSDILLRDSGISGKLLWLHLCVTRRPVARGQLNRLKALSERRNQFLHYKWKLRDVETDDYHSSRAADAAEALVRFLTRFERQHFFKGQKRAMRRYLRTLAQRHPPRNAAPAKSAR